MYSAQIIDHVAKISNHYHKFVISKACFPLAIFSRESTFFAAIFFRLSTFFYDRARDANFKCQQINMAAVNIRHLLNVKVNIIRLLLLRRRRKRLEKYKKRLSVRRICAERE